LSQLNTTQIKLWILIQKVIIYLLFIQLDLELAFGAAAEWSVFGPIKEFVLPLGLAGRLVAMPKSMFFLSLLLSSRLLPCLGFIGTSSLEGLGGDA
jgi:hypothetical protein